MNYKAEYEKAINKKKEIAEYNLKFSQPIKKELVENGFVFDNDESTYNFEFDKDSIFIVRFYDNFIHLECFDKRRFENPHYIVPKFIKYSEHSIQEINKVFKKCLDKVV